MVKKSNWEDKTRANPVKYAWIAVALAGVSFLILPYGFAAGAVAQAVIGLRSSRANKAALALNIAAILLSIASLGLKFALT